MTWSQAAISCCCPEVLAPTANEAGRARDGAGGGAAEVEGFAAQGEEERNRILLGQAAYQPVVYVVERSIAGYVCGADPAMLSTGVEEQRQPHL